MAGRMRRACAADPVPVAGGNPVAGSTWAPKVWNMIFQLDKVGYDQNLGFTSNVLAAQAETDR